MTNRSTRRRKGAHASQSSGVVAVLARLDSLIHWITLVTLVALPVVFGSSETFAIRPELKRVVLHLSAISIASLWCWQWTLEQNLKLDLARFDIKRWITTHPANLLITVMSIWVFVQVISALLSPIPHISILGADDQRSGYNLYDNISFFVLFLSVATRFRSVEKLKSVSVALVIGGTITAVYGVSKHFGFDPLGDGENFRRAYSSFGNPLNFGAFMVLVIPVTFALLLLAKPNDYRWQIGIGAVLGLELAGLWFAGGRGPYVGALGGIVVAAILTWRARQAIPVNSLLTSVGTGVILAIVLIVLPSPNPDVGTERVLSIGDQIVGLGSESTELSSGLEGRFNIWGTTLDMATSWDTPQEESGLASALRPVFGQGQDMFLYAFPLAGEPRVGTDVADHAHNYPLQILIEQGFAGLLILLAIALIVLSLLYKLHKQFQPDGDIGLIALNIAFVASIVGTMIVLLTGVQRVADLTPAFAMLGGLAAMSAISISPKESNRESSGFTLSKQTASGLGALAAVAVTVVGLWVFFDWDVRRTTASVEWVSAFNKSSDLEKAQTWVDVQSKAPERPHFTNSLFIELFNAAFAQKEQGLDEEAVVLMHRARTLLLDFEELDPFKRDVQINLFQTEVALHSWGEEGISARAVERADRILELYPTAPLYTSVIAADMPTLGEYELAIEYADQAIATELKTKPWPLAWYAKGRGLLGLGNEDEAIAALRTGTEIEPGSEEAKLSHRLLAQIYSDRGETELAEEHSLLGN